MIIPVPGLFGSWTLPSWLVTKILATHLLQPTLS